MEKLNQKFSEYSVYFEDIRRRVYSVAIIFGIFFILGFFQAGSILRFIISFFKLKDASVVTTSPFQFLDLATKIGLYTALLICIPLLVFHIYDFFKDGLNKNEKRLFFTLLPVSLALFISGFSYCLAILYFYLSSVSSINLSFGISNVWDISSFISQVIMASAIFGLVFQFPIILTFLIRIGLVKLEFLKKNRRYAIAGIFIFVGFLPPPDIFSTIIEALPLVVLYQVTIWVNSAYSLKHDYVIETAT